MWLSDSERDYHIKQHGLQATEALEAFIALPKEDFEAQYRFLIQHEDILGDLAPWEAVITACPVNERIRIEGAMEAEGLL